MYIAALKSLVPTHEDVDINASLDRPRSTSHQSVATTAGLLQTGIESFHCSPARSQRCPQNPRTSGLLA